MIRPALFDDARTIARVIIKTWEKSFSGIIDPDYPKSMNEEQFAAVIGDNISQEKETIFLFEDEGLIQGFISGRFLKGMKNGWDCETVGFYILPQYQGGGIGKALLNHLKNHFKDRGCNTMIIWTLLHAKNNGFYERMGGTASGRKTIELGDRGYPGVGFVFHL